MAEVNDTVHDLRAIASALPETNASAEFPELQEVLRDAAKEIEDGDRLQDQNLVLTTLLAERTRERDEALAVIAEPTEAEMDAYRASLTPQDIKRHEALREIVVDPDLVDRLRAALSASQAEIERLRALVRTLLAATPPSCIPLSEETISEVNSWPPT